MSSPAERIMSAYDWAVQVRQSKKSPMRLLLCAWQIEKAVAKHEDDYGATLAAFGELLADWKSQAGSRRGRGEDASPGLLRAIEVVSYLIGAEQSETAETAG